MPHESPFPVLYCNNTVDWDVSNPEAVRKLRSILLERRRSVSVILANSQRCRVRDYYNLLDELRAAPWVQSVDHFVGGAGTFEAYFTVLSVYVSSPGAHDHLSHPPEE